MLLEVYTIMLIIDRELEPIPLLLYFFPSVGAVGLDQLPMIEKQISRLHDTQNISISVSYT